MRRYLHTHWSFSLARLAYRLEDVTSSAIEQVQNEDQASWHFEGRSLTLIEELQCWWAGFWEGWRAAARSGHPWFQLAQLPEATSRHLSR